MLQQIYDEACNSSTWNDKDPAKCGCRGSGWFLSDLDTEHLCHLHNDGQPSRAHGEEEDWAVYEAKKNGTWVAPVIEKPPVVASEELDEIPF